MSRPSRFCSRMWADQPAVRLRLLEIEPALKALEGVAAVLFDEFHERSLDADLGLALARQKQVLAKVVYHKLCDPDHKKLRTLVEDGELRHVNNGYCTLLETGVDDQRLRPGRGRDQPAVRLEGPGGKSGHEHGAHATGTPPAPTSRYR